MGRGNFDWQRHNDVTMLDQDGEPIRRMVYIENPPVDEDLGELNGFHWQEWNEGLEDTIANALSDSFTRVDEPIPQHDAVVAFENGLFRIILSDAYDRTAVTVTPQPDAPAFAPARMDAVADWLFAALKLWGYEPRVRCGPWTSGAY